MSFKEICVYLDLSREKRRYTMSYFTPGMWPSRVLYRKKWILPTRSLQVGWYFVRSRKSMSYIFKSFFFFGFFWFFLFFFLVMILLGFITQRPIATRDLVVPILINVDYYGDLLARGLTLNVTTKILMATKQETVDISRLTTPLQNVLTSRLAFSYD